MPAISITDRSWRRPAPYTRPVRALARIVALSIALTASIASLCVVVPSVEARAAGSRGAAPKITPKGIGKLRLGTPLAVIQRAHLLGRTHRGCDLAWPAPIVAQLSPPLEGTATFSGSGAHRLQAISITGGAKTDRGVGVGDRASKVRRAYPSATVQDAPPGDPLQLHAITVAEHGKTVLWLELGRAGGRVTEIDIPSLETCE
jgi:hypothetical protein